MKKALLWILGVVVGLFVVLLIISLFMPSHGNVVRTLVIKNTPSSKVFAVINDVHQFQDWSPWAKIDPKNTSYTFYGPATGVGSGFNWKSSNSDVGNGKYEIVKSEADRHVAIDITFEGMDKAKSDMFVEQVGADSKVTWTFNCDFNGFPMMRLMAPMMESYVGDDYDRGLNNLSAYARSKQ